MSNDADMKALATEVAAAVERRLGTTDPEIGRIVAQEIQGAMGLSQPQASRPQTAASRIVVTAHGSNRPGVVAQLAAAIDEFEGDIRDLSQTIVGDYFTMLFVVDISEAMPEGARFGQLRHLVDGASEFFRIDPNAIDRRADRQWLAVPI